MNLEESNRIYQENKQKNTKKKGIIKDRDLVIKSLKEAIELYESIKDKVVFLSPSKDSIKSPISISL